MLDGARSGELEGETNLHKWILKLHVKRKFITFSKCVCKKNFKVYFCDSVWISLQKSGRQNTHRAAFEFSWQTREYTGAADQIVRCAKLSQFTDFKENSLNSAGNLSLHIQAGISQSGQ